MQEHEHAQFPRKISDQFCQTW